MNELLHDVGRWSVDYALAATAVLLLAAMAVALLRQPAQRLVVIWASLVGAGVLVPLIVIRPVPHISLFGNSEETASAVGDEDRHRENMIPFDGPPTADEPPEVAPKHSAPEPVTVASNAVMASQSQQPRASNVSAIRSWTLPQGQTVERFLMPIGALVAMTASIVAAWSVFGMLMVWWMVHTSRDVSARFCDRLARIVGPANRPPRLRQTALVSQPAAVGTLWPTILLPDWFGADSRDAEIAAALAHEWDHIRRADLWLLAVLRWLSVLLFAHPLYWWLRRRCLMEQDLLADSAASRTAGSSDYAEMLVRWASAGARMPRIAPSLTVISCHTQLKRRLAMLLDRSSRIERGCSVGWHVGVWAAAAVLACGMSCVSLVSPHARAEPPRETDESPNRLGTATTDDGSIVFNCRVVDHETGAGISNASVVVYRTVRSRDPSKYNELIARSEYTTDSDGSYTVTFPPAEASNDKIYVELDVTHDEYPPRKGFGYALAMIKKNLKMGERPFFETVKIRPGKPVTGVVRAPDGKPAAGVRVLGYSNIADYRKPSERGSYEYGSFADATADADGRFRFVAITPGKCVFWIVPEDYQPSSHFIDDKRGDVGTFSLEEGVVLTGRVVDADGKPLPGVFLEAEGADRAQHGMPVASAIERHAETDEKGEFSLAPLPQGDCTIIPVTHRYDRVTGKHEMRDLPAVFYHTTVSLTPETNPAFVEIKAMPHVTLEFQYVDSNGEPTTGWDLHLWGRRPSNQVGEDTPRRDTSWWGKGRAGRGDDDKGQVVMRVPKGMITDLKLMSNEHGALRLQIDENAPKLAGNRINLGAVTADMPGILIHRYVAPVVLIRVNSSGDVEPKGIKVKGRYADDDISAVVRFERQEDGRFRSSQLLPNEKVTYTISAEGSHPVVMELPRPKEGDVREVDVTLAPQRQDEPSEKTAVFAPVTP